MRRLTLTGPRGSTFRCAVATTRRERSSGLLGRPPLAIDETLLLPRCTSVHTLGMRTSILVARLDRTGRVRDVRVLRPGRLLLPTWRRGAVLECHPDADVRVGDVLSGSGQEGPDDA